MSPCGGVSTFKVGKPCPCAVEAAVRVTGTYEGVAGSLSTYRGAESEVGNSSSDPNCDSPGVVSGSFGEMLPQPASSVKVGFWKRWKLGVWPLLREPSRLYSRVLGDNDRGSPKVLTESEDDL